MSAWAFLHCKSMANPQKENGFVSIANELLEKICSAPISGSEFRILLFTIRKTYGYGKKLDWISLSQYAAGTGLPRPNVSKVLKLLVVKRLLYKEENRYGINKNYSQWLVVKRLPPVVKRLRQVVVKRLHTKENLQKKDTATEVAPTKMKKNRMGSYREDSSADSHEEVVDFDTGETVKAKPRAGVLPIYKDLVEWSEKRRGFKFISVVKQYKAFKEAKTFGLGPADLKNRWLDLEADKFYAEKGFDWTTVVYSFNKKQK